MRKEAPRNLQKQLEEERNRLQHQALEMEREKEQFINRIQLKHHSTWKRLAVD